MTVSKRFALISAVNLVLIAAGWPFGLHLYLFIFYNLLIIGLFALDYVITPSPEKCVAAERGENNKLYYKTDNQIDFNIFNNSRYYLTIQAKDAISDRHFIITDEYLKYKIPPGRDEKFFYSCVPTKRGAFTFPEIYIRVYGLMGLCVKYSTINCPGEFKIFPNVKDIGKYRIMTQNNRLLPRGEKKLRFYGDGMEFESLRPYVEGDDYRSINWMATARENRLTVNRYQMEKNQPVMILIDAGRPMSYTLHGYKKLDYAINAALILSDTINYQNDSSGMLVFDAELKNHIPPGKGAVHRTQFMEALYHIQETRQTSDFEAAFRLLCTRQKRRSLVFIFTDFEIPEEADSFIKHIAFLKKYHMPVLTFMKDENLNALADMQVFNKKDKVLREVANEFKDERKNFYQKLNAMRIPNIECEAERFTTTAVNQYLSMRNF